MKMTSTDEVEAVMGGVRMGVNVDIKRTDGKSDLRQFCHFFNILHQNHVHF